MRNLDRYTIVFIYIKSLVYVCPTVDLFIIDHHHHHQRHPLNRPSTAAASLLHSSRNKWKPNIKSGKLYFCVFDGIGTTININIFATSHCVMDRETAVTIKLGRCYKIIFGLKREKDEKKVESRFIARDIKRIKWWVYSTFLIILLLLTLSLCYSSPKSGQEEFPH